MKKLFGSRQVETPQADKKDQFIPIPDKYLFTEDRHPEEMIESRGPSKPKEKTLLEDLLSQDFMLKGERDAYSSKDMTALGEGLKLIAMEFRQVYDKAILELDEKIEFLRLHLTDTLEEESMALHDKVYHSLSLLKKQKLDLVTQKDLAMTGEGYIEKAYTEYKVGFIRGYGLYLEGEVLFKPTKTL
ncbi:hypothetical protein [Algoriphagus formosus]|uniref:hypothetical protein n=1 Tax=Algoriphagus formosus TaxID=2007308 RepID=UPI000C28AF4B|nr:hypothetical protein [Algoriphagus formosus]